MNPIIRSFLRICLLYSLLVHVSVVFCGARLLTAYEQAYGPWKLTLHRCLFSNKWFLEQLDDNERKGFDITRNCIDDTDLQLLFPTQSRDPGSNGTERSFGMKQVRSVPCVLHLKKNGKFILQIDDEDCPPPTKKYSVTSVAISENATSQSSLHRFPLQGEWFLFPNPYCVTDRLYDTLTLISEPRLRRVHHHNKSFLTERARVELRCKLWGRYGIGSVRNKIGLRHERERGRMTHGTVMIVQECVDPFGVYDGTFNRHKTRKIIGTFTGQCSDSYTVCSDQTQLGGSVDNDENDSDEDFD